MKEYIIYLEPKKDSELSSFIEAFLELSKTSLCPTEAYQYHPHCSITGFFAAPASLVENDVVEALDKFDKSEISIGIGVVEIKKYQENNVNFDSPPLISITSNTLKTPSIRLSLQIKGCSEIVPQLHKIIPSIRSKPLDHISLAYFSSFKNAPLKEEREYLVNTEKENIGSTTISYIPEDHFKMAKEFFGKLKYTERDDWNIVLYERQYNSPLLKEKHVFREVKKWDLL